MPRETFERELQRLQDEMLIMADFTFSIKPPAGPARWGLAFSGTFQEWGHFIQALFRPVGYTERENTVVQGRRERGA
jgi:hypothetical protein